MQERDELDLEPLVLVRSERARLEVRDALFHGRARHSARACSYAASLSDALARGERTPVQLG
jgi:hypothetical protein